MHKKRASKIRGSFFIFFTIKNSLDKSKRKCENFFLHFGDMNDFGSINQIIRKVNPDEIYHLAAISNSSEIWNDYITTYNVDGISVVRKVV